MPDTSKVGLSIILMVIGIYILAATMPDAISAIVNATTDNWGPAEKAIWSLLPLIFIAAVIFMYLPAIVIPPKHLKKWER